MFLRSLLVLALSLVIVGPARAYDPVTKKMVPEASKPITLKVADSEKHGKYLTDEYGRAVYVFTADRQGMKNQSPAISCTEQQCLQGWPPLYVKGKPKAGKGVDASKIGVIAFSGKKVVTYNGWPLYYFIMDGTSGKTRGQAKNAFGGDWHLVSPAGTEIKD